MALIRRAALTQVGGLAEWCITEDAELGLRLFEAGHRAVYTEKSYGKGLMPDSFVAYRKQRYRWAYGAMMIMKRHWRELLPFGQSKLHPQQRYQFLAGWLPWIADGLQLSFIILALVWTAGMILAPNLMQPPLTLYLIVTLGMFFFKVGKSIWLYSQKVPCGFLDNLGASIAASRSPIRWRRRSGAAPSPTTCRSTAPRRWRTRPLWCAVSSMPGKRP